jgi:hypothetical protein
MGFYIDVVDILSAEARGKLKSGTKMPYSSLSIVIPGHKGLKNIFCMTDWRYVDTERNCSHKR